MVKEIRKYKIDIRLPKMKYMGQNRGKGNKKKGDILEEMVRERSKTSEL